MTWISTVVTLAALVACLAHGVVTATLTKERLPAHERPKRMVGGLMAGLLPWQAMVYLGEGVFDGGYAGGALISDRWVLTAGRNLFIRRSRNDTRGKEPLVPKVYLGISHLSKADASTEVAVEKVFLHPAFQNTSDWDNDLALIQLKEPVTFSQTVYPIPLPERGDDLEERPGSLGIVAGWGWGTHFTQSKALKFTKLPVASRETCRARYREFRHTPLVDDNMFCTGPGQWEVNVCFWDAGGALALARPRDGGVYAAGILSYDKGCAVERYAVYTKVAAYLPWVHEVMRGDRDYSSVRSSVMERMLQRLV